MVWFTFVVGVFLGWLAIEARSVWPAVIGHAAINSFGTLGSLVSIGHPSSLLGPTPVGLIASLPFTIVALWLLWRMGTHPLEDANLNQAPVVMQHANP